MFYDVRQTGRHADDECEDGNQDDQQVAQAEQAEPQVSRVLVDIGERQEVDDGRERDAHGRQTESANQRDQVLQVRYSDGQENCGHTRKTRGQLKSEYEVYTVILYMSYLQVSIPYDALIETPWLRNTDFYTIA